MPDTLRLRHLSMTFGGQRALDDVEFAIARGEVHGLVGQNGCGKSTLIKVLSGYHRPDPGAELEIDGRRVDLPVHPVTVKKLGLSFVHQDLALLPSLSVMENFRSRKIATASQWLMRWSKERRETEEALAEFGVHIDGNAKVIELPPVQRALLAIVRAVQDLEESYGSSGEQGGLLVLDEPTVFLPRTDRDHVFRVVREIAARGGSVLFVSHDLEEALGVTDRVTVLRDGRVAGTMTSKSTSQDDLIEMIIGRRLDAMVHVGQKRHVQKTTHVSVEGLNGSGVLDVSFAAKKGEILGLTGLAGSGFEEVPYLLFGAHQARSGRLTIGDECLDLTALTPSSATKAGIALVPADRQNAAGVGELTVGENVMLQVMGRYGPYRLDRRRMDDDAMAALRTYDVRPPDPEMRFQALSGGNQQKVVLAKWLQTNPQLLVVHEPTQGVDVGARRQVTELVIKAAAEEGMCVICASSDAEQLADMCDRVLVFCEGGVMGELDPEHISKERITEQCYRSVVNRSAEQDVGQVCNR